MPQLGHSCLLFHLSVASHPTILNHVVWDADSIVKQTTKKEVYYQELVSYETELVN